MRMTLRAARRQTPLRKSLTFLTLVAGVLAGTVLYRRRSARRLERVELYAADGSMVSLPESSPELERMLDLTREVLSVP
jgi:hypothetical protein